MPTRRRRTRHDPAQPGLWSWPSDPMEQIMLAHCAVTDDSGGVEVVSAPSDLDEVADAVAACRRAASDRLREQRERGGTSSSASSPVAASPRYPDTIAQWSRDNPPSHSWAPLQGWGWLRGLVEPERSAAKFLAWAVQESGTVGGTVAFLTFPDGGDIELVVSALEQVDLIRTYETSGVRRWERRRHGAHHHDRTHEETMPGTEPGPQNRSTPMSNTAGCAVGDIITDATLLERLPEGTVVDTNDGDTRKKTWSGDEWDFVMLGEEILVEGKGSVKVILLTGK